MNIDLSNPAIIIAATFVAATSFVYWLVPKDLEAFRKEFKEQAKVKKGLLLWVSPILSVLAKKVQNAKSERMQKYFSRLRQSLYALDVEGYLSPAEFVAIQICIPVIFIFLMIFCAYRIPMFAVMQNPVKLLSATPLLFLFGAGLPYLVLQDKVNQRKKKISRDLPFTLDMLTSAVQAGLDFTGAIRRLIEKATKETPLLKECKLMLKEINLGKTRSEALRRMSDRVDLDELSSVVAALIQADQLGTSLGSVLTNLSDDLRVKRFQMAEKLALEAPVKMIFPLVMFIFPAVFIILMGPIFIQMSQTQ